jgi:phage terminase large subunit
MQYAPSQYGNYDNQRDFDAQFGQVMAEEDDAGWELQYKPRKELVAFHQREQRFAFLICHRRFGKTVGCVAEMILRALYTPKHKAQYAYICPFRSQAKAVAWNYLVDMTQGIAIDVKVSELSITLPNGAKIWLSGSDNVNALRGLYLDGAVIDEFAQCRPDLLEAVIQPCLLDRKGWLVLIGTAYGRLNKFYDYYEKSKEDPEWFHADIKVYDSGVIPLDEIHRIKNAVSDAKFNQEFMNDFSAELVGTYYAAIINEIEQLGQINQDTHWNPDLQVHVAFDIGRGDNTVAWFLGFTQTEKVTPGGGVIGRI